LKVAVIISAGGKGSRFGGKVTKQFITVEGKPILSHVISRFETSELVNLIFVAVPEDSIKLCMNKCIEPFHFQKVIEVIPGGKERSDSVFNCLKQLDGSVDLVMIHDGVRIFVTHYMIKESVEKAAECGSSVCAIPLSDTIKVITKNRYVKQTRSREGIYCMQTPQTFKRDIIVDAYEKAGVARSGFTDDSSIVEEYTDCKTKIIDGHKFNIKITSEEDLEMARIFLRAGY